MLVAEIIYFLFFKYYPESKEKMCLFFQVSETNNIEADSDVSMEIPSGTVIAYSVLELEIKKDGRFSECVL